MSEGEAPATVHVVDDDPQLRDGLGSLFRSIGLRVVLFASAAEFLRGPPPEGIGCLVVDVRMPGLSGLDFQHELARRSIDMPIVFLTGHGDIPMSVRAMKAGAIEFLTKPFREQDLLDAVRVGIDRDRARRIAEASLRRVRHRFDHLTQREREIVRLVAAGLMNKQIAAEIGISEITVKVHRGSAMRKLEAKSLADLVRMIDMVAGRPSPGGTDG